MHNKDEFIRLRNDYDIEKNILMKYSKNFLSMIRNLLVNDKILIFLIILTIMIYSLIAIVLIVFK